jgi:hypothetical protein
VTRLNFRKPIWSSSHTSIQPKSSPFCSARSQFSVALYKISNLKKKMDRFRCPLLYSDYILYNFYQKYTFLWQKIPVR